MASLLLTSSAVVVCSHRGHCQSQGNSRVKLSGVACLTSAGAMMIAGCKTSVPCTAAQTVSPGTQRVRASGQAMLAAGGVLVAMNGQPVVIVNPGQTRVQAR